MRDYVLDELVMAWSIPAVYPLYSGDEGGLGAWFGCILSHQHLEPIHPTSHLFPYVGLDAESRGRLLRKRSHVTTGYFPGVK